MHKSKTNNSISYNSNLAAQRRCKLFTIWEKTGSIQKACTETQMSRSTFYYWKERFEEGGYSALEVERSHAPINPHRTEPAIEAEVIGLKKAHPHMGKAQISRKLEEVHGKPVISPNTVRRVLVDANLWEPSL
ncbi:MAG: helix-turn-helix domain-containing protein [Chloroflexota bacterium]